ncbi:MAG: penicillin-binding protein [Clostridiales bacterium]|nr:penicillin-binding protein [Clostridiales bacterium]
MKQLKKRTLFVLFFILALILGMCVLLVFYVLNGASWASYSANRHVYSNGSISSGSIADRNGVVLYDCENDAYNDDYEIRVSTVHAIGDRNGSISVGAKSVFADELVGFSLIFGTNGTGNQVNLTLDAQLNKVAYEAMDGRDGVVALYNYKTGDLLCMLSTPAFDPDDEDEIAAINAGDESYDGAYLNRFLSSTYTPGSTFKLVTSAAAIETLSDLDSFTFTCDGSLEYNDGSTVTCPSAHGTVDFETALADSCNGAFATLANEIGGETLQQYAEEAGLLSSLSVSGIPTATGSFSTTISAVDEGWSGVGQYEDLVNPCAMLTLMGCIASGGEAAVPRLLLSVTGSVGLTTTEATETTSIGWASSTCEQLTTMMRNNVVSHYGQSQFGDLAVCAKSGTAEVGSGSPHAWFVGFIDDEEYPYAFVVIVENGGWGSSVAGSVAAAVLEAACS